MTKLQEAQTLFRQMETKMNKAAAVLDRFPVDRYVEFIDEYPEVADYNHVNPEVKGYSDAILKEYGPDTIEHYHKRHSCSREIVTRNGGRLHYKGPS